MGDYSVETSNRFQLMLDDDDADVYDILKEEESKSEKKKKDLSLAKEDDAKKNVKFGDKNSNKSKGKNKKFENSNATTTSSSNTTKSINKTFNSKGNENQPPRFRQPNDSPKIDEFVKPPSQDQQQSGGFGGRGSRRGGSAGFRGNRGGGGRGGGFRRFDRHSGSDRTGVKAVEKRDGFGSHNWGNEVDAQLDTSAQEEPRPDSGEKADESTTINADDAGVEGEPVIEPEPEMKEMTLDEWKAAQASSRIKQQFNVRRAGEGEDQKQWKSAVALEPRKRAESTESYEEEEEVHEKMEETRAALNKLNIQIKFSDNAPSRGGGGGRGGRGRGRGGFGGPRADRRPPRSGGGGGFDGRHPRSGGGGGFDGRPPRRGGGRGGYNSGGREGYNPGGFQRNSSREEATAPIMDNEIEFPSLGAR